MKTERLLAEREKGFIQYGLITDGAIAGYVQLERANDETYYIEKLAVLPKNRQAGYGRKLLDFAADKIRELGGKKIGIAIIEENHRLKQWYSDYGFVHTGTRKYEHLPFTVGFMELYI